MLNISQNIFRFVFGIRFVTPGSIYKFEHY